MTSRLQDDISFNFLVGGDGRIYEGRGWDVEGEPTASHTNRSIRLGFIGQFEIDDPAEPQVNAAIKLIEYGVKNLKISENYHVKALKQVTYFNENPGDNLYKIIKNWEHWDPSGSDSENNETAYLENENNNSDDKDDSNDNNNNNLKIVKREEWEALEPKKSPKKLKVLPATFIIICQTNTQACRFKKKCVKSVRDLQISAMMSRLQDDISFNFLVGGDGQIYEGRGWDVEGEPTASHTNRSIRLGFIGQFETDDPVEPQVNAAIKLIEYGVKNLKVSKDYHVKALKQVAYFNKNPGDNLYKIIKNWEHWDPSGLGPEDDKTAYLDKKFRENPMYGLNCKPVVTTTFRSSSRFRQGPRVSCVMREITPSQSHVPNFAQRPDYFPKYGNW